MHQHCRDVHYRGQRQVRHIVYINIDTNINTPYLSTHHLYQYQYQYQCTQSIPPLYLYQYTTHIAETSITVDNVRLTSSLPLCSFPTTLMCHILYPPPPPPILGLWSTVDMSNKRPMTSLPPFLPPSPPHLIFPTTFFHSLRFVVDSGYVKQKTYSPPLTPPFAFSL